MFRKTLSGWFLQSRPGRFSLGECHMRNPGLSQALRLAACTAAFALVAAGCSSSSSPKAGGTTPATAAPASTSAGAPTAGASASITTSAPITGAPTSGAPATGATGSTTPEAGTDDGANLTMWVRAATGPYSQRLVDDYNSSHKNHVTLTVIPSDSYQQKIGVAAGSHSLPDLLASDVVYSPNYVHEGLFADITSQVKALPFFAQLSQAHMQAASAGGKIYAVPHKVDSSLILYNKDLFQKAGISTPPKTFTDIYNDAKAVRGLGGDTYGFYFAGACAGCNAYTTMPYSVAGGHPPLTDDGKKADIDNPALQQAYALYKRMFDDGLVPSAAKTDNGSTWTTQFEAGKIGMLPAGTFVFADMAKVKFNWGITPLMSPDGSKTSTFVGGDVLGIAQSSKKEQEAWNFVAWTLGDHAQVEDIAKNGDLRVVAQGPGH